MSSAYRISRCDVVDRESLKEFRKKRREWRHWFAEDNPNSVTSQLSQILMDHGVYRILYRKALDIGDQSKEEISLYNTYIFLFFENSWLKLQAIGIRKLLESGEYKNGKIKPNKLQVISLRRIAEDIRDYWHLFTRENYVCHDGVPFDSKKASERYIKKFPPSRNARIQPIHGPLAWSRSRKRHEEFDKLSGKLNPSGSRDETLPDNIIQQVISRLDENNFKDIIDVTNKLVVHSSDRHSRKFSSTNLKLPVRFSRIESVHKELCLISNYLSIRIISGDDHESFLPMAQFNEVEYLEKPWVPRFYLKTLKKYWKEYEKKVHDYGRQPPFSL